MHGESSHHTLTTRMSCLSLLHRYLLAMRHAPPEGVQRADEADAVHNGKGDRQMP